jgi:hypothetical protein
MKPIASSMIKAGVRTRPSWSHARVGKYIPIQSASLTITPDDTGGVEGKRWLRNATMGSEVPVKANTLRKKNSHRGPTVGIVKLRRAYKPPQPIKARISAAGIKVLTGGDDWEAM